MGITEEEFMDYVKIQKSGVTNMFAVDVVVSYSDCLDKEKCIEIMKNYNELHKKYIGDKDEL